MSAASENWIEITIGGPEDPMRDFPSTRSMVAKRHFDQTGERTTFKTVGHEAITFIQNYCVLTTARWAGQPFKLLDFQKRFLLEMCEVVAFEDTYILRYRWVLLGLAKKNGKSEIAAALSIWFATREPAASVACCANSDDQAKLVHGAAKKIVDMSPSLSQFASHKDKLITVRSFDSPGEVKRIAAAVGSNDGANFSAVVVDEIHEFVTDRARAMFVTMTGGGGAREEPINIMITTAGSLEEALWYEFYSQVQAIMLGEVIDDTLYGCWFAIDEDDDYKDESIWWKSNPGLDEIVNRSVLRDMLTKRRPAEWIRYYGNRMTEADDLWHAAEVWDDLQEDYEFDVDKPLYVGIDIGRKHDSSAVVWCQWDDSKVLHVTGKFWFNPYRRNDPRYDEWRMNVAEVENLCRDLRGDFHASAYTDPEDNFPLAGPVFAYDPHFFSRSADDLEIEGLNMLEMPQHDSTMVPASQNIYQMIVNGDINHDGNAVLRRHIRSVVAKERERGWRISKIATSRHIDGAIALALAAYVAVLQTLEHEDSGFNIH